MLMSLCFSRLQQRGQGNTPKKALLLIRSRDLLHARREGTEVGGGGQQSGKEVAGDGEEGPPPEVHGRQRPGGGVGGHRGGVQKGHGEDGPKHGRVRVVLKHICQIHHPNVECIQRVKKEVECAMGSGAMVGLLTWFLSLYLRKKNMLAAAMDKLASPVIKETSCEVPS